MNVTTTPIKVRNLQRLLMHFIPTDCVFVAEQTTVVDPVTLHTRYEVTIRAEWERDYKPPPPYLFRFKPYNHDPERVEYVLFPNEWEIKMSNEDIIQWNPPF